MFDISDLLRLSTIPRVGARKFRSLVNHFKDPAHVLRASPRELAKVHGIDRNLALSIARHRADEGFVGDQLKRIRSSGARVVSLWDEEYPELLRKIYDPPPFLFVLGQFSPADRSCLAIVGTRKPSQYGQRVSEKFSAGLAAKGVTIASGLARGIDTLAHGSALEAGGRTLAVIGSGLDVFYPPENKGLFTQIIRKGAVLSEFPMGAKPDPQNFPRRNRLISGLSVGVIVVESDEDGGAMITASTALDQNREVFAVPGNIFEPRSRGTHWLVQQGQAKLVRDTEDVLAELPAHLGLRDTTREIQHPTLTLFELSILDKLGEEAIHVDTISERSGISISDVLVTLLSLEFKGIVRQLPGKMFRRS